MHASPVATATLTRTFQIRGLPLAPFAPLFTKSDAEGRELPAIVARMFADPEVGYIHAHNAKPGCFSCRIERAPA